MRATSAPAAVAAPQRRRHAIAGAARPQLTVMAAQGIAGAGNLVFAMAAARVVGADHYADVATFLALYLLLHVPAAALSAAGALDPRGLARQRRSIAAIGAAAAVVIGLGAQPLSRLVGLPPLLVIALAAAAPAAGLLGLERGIAYGHERHRALVSSLVAEPCARVAIGLGLGVAFGAPGAAFGAVAAGYVALVVCVRDPVPVAPSGTTVESSGAASVLGLAFVGLAALQNADLLLANRHLDPLAAAQFGVLSTLGGAAAFATATIPMVLLPSATRQRTGATSTAVGLTIAAGGGIAVAGALAAEQLVTHGFGEEYAPVAGLLGPYLVAMGLLGLLRVMVAQRCAAGDGRYALVAVLAALALHLAALASWGHSAAALAGTTLLTTGGLAAVLSFPQPVRASGRWLRMRAAAPVPRSTWALLGLCCAAAAVRMASSRGLWVDEAISVRQAQLGFGQMLDDMQTTDVHPPLHYAVLWITVRAFGVSEFAVRLPSLVAGVALVPALYWVGRVVYDRRTGWVAAALGACAPFCVWYSQEARMYAMFMLFATLALGAHVQAVRRGERRDWVAYAAATAAMAWTQYFAILPIAVQQGAFAWALWRRRADPGRRRSLALGWVISTALVAVACLPLFGVVERQFHAYSGRSEGLVPGQAGAGSSTFGGTISVYAVGANLIWAIWGYHADGVMAQIAALWPLVMLLGLVLLGRGRSGPSVLLLASVVVPMAALFIVGSVKRDLFELRYFCGAVPAALLLGARLVTATTRRRRALVVAAALVTSTMAVGLVDQQLNGANPRLYDFEGALAQVRAGARPGDVVLYEPAYLAEVIDYYAADLDARPLRSDVPPGAGAVWVLATERVLDAQDTAAKVGDVLAVLDQQRDVVDRFDRPNVRVWELR